MAKNVKNLKRNFIIFLGIMIVFASACLVTYFSILNSGIFDQSFNLDTATITYNPSELKINLNKVSNNKWDINYSEAELNKSEDIDTNDGYKLCFKPVWTVSDGVYKITAKCFEDSTVYNCNCQIKIENSQIVSVSASGGNTKTTTASQIKKITA